MFDASNNGSVKPNNSPEMVEVVESSVGTLGTPRLQRAGFVPKIRRHFKKFWWLHSIIFCASFLVIALCLVYVALPRIAQSGVNSSSLSFYELQFLDPKPNSITLTQKATLHTTTIFTPTLDPFTASLWLATSGIFPSDPITSIELPAIHALHPDSNVTIINQVLNISNPQELADFTIQVLSQENVTTALTGSTRAHEGKLPVVTINYNSSITYKSLNGLRGFNATNLKLNLTAAAGDPNLIGNAYIPNPSVMTVEMGNVTLQLSTAQKGVVGLAAINNLTIRPGDNNIPITAVVDMLAILASKDLTTGLVTMGITGNSSVYNGNRIPYYEKALASNKLSLELNLTQILADSS